MARPVRRRSVHSLFRPQMSVFGSGPVVSGGSCGALKGAFTIAINRPGTYIMTYWSSLVDREVGQSKPFDIEGPSEVWLWGNWCFGGCACALVGDKGHRGPWGPGPGQPFTS